MLAKLIEQMYWANKVAINWLKVDENGTEEQVRLMSHILNAENVWICRAQGSTGDRNTFKTYAVQELDAFNEKNHEDFQLLLRRDGQEVIEYKLFEGTPGKSTLEDLLLHVITHGFHHRGQMAMLASKAGRSFPNSSFIGYTRKP